MSVLPTNKSLRSDLWQIRIRNECDGYGIEATDIDVNGEFIGLVENMTPPDPENNYELAVTVRPNNYMPDDGAIGVSPTVGVGNWVGAYTRSIALSGTISNAALTSGNLLVYALGSTTNTISGNRITHTITERLVIPSFTMEIGYYNTNGNPEDNLWVRYLGCKIDSLTVDGREGDYLRYTARIMARDVRHNIAEVASTETEKSWLDFSQVLEDNESRQPIDISFQQEPYVFSGGKIEIYEPSGTNQPHGPVDNSTYGRVKAFSLNIENGLRSEFYVKKHIYGTPILSELTETPRKYHLSVTINPDDQDIYRLFQQNGDYGAERRGYGIRIRYDRPLAANFQGDDYIEFRMPASTRGVVNRNWNSGFSYTSNNPVGPIAGHESVNPVIGCFIQSATHNRDYDNALMESVVEFIVPSLEVYVQDNTNYAECETLIIPSPPSVFSCDGQVYVLTDGTFADNYFRHVSGTTWQQKAAGAPTFPFNGDRRLRWHGNGVMLHNSHDNATGFSTLAYTQDAGETWSYTTMPIEWSSNWRVYGHRRDILGRIWAAIADETPTPNNNGLIYSDDNGATWTLNHVLAGIYTGGGPAFDVACHPSDSNKIAYSMTGNNGDVRIDWSNNRGATWTRRDAPDALVANSYDLLWLPNGRVIAFHSNAFGDDVFVYTTDDEGVVWTNRFQSANDAPGTSRITAWSYGYHNNLVWAAGSLAPSGGMALLRSLDGGTTWDYRAISPINERLQGADYDKEGDIWFHMTSLGNVYCLHNFSTTDIAALTTNDFEYMGNPLGAAINTNEAVLVFVPRGY